MVNSCSVAVSVHSFSVFLWSICWCLFVRLCLVYLILLILLFLHFLSLSLSLHLLSSLLCPKQLCLASGVVRRHSPSAAALRFREGIIFAPSNASNIVPYQYCWDRTSCEIRWLRLVRAHSIMWLGEMLLSALLSLVVGHSFSWVWKEHCYSKYFKT